MLTARTPKLLRKPFLEVPVVVQGGEVVGYHLGLEPGPDLGVVDGEGGQVAEQDGQLELFDGEVVLVAVPIEAQHSLEVVASQEGDRQERLGFRRLVRDQPRSRIRVGIVHQLRDLRCGGLPDDAGPVRHRPHRQDLLHIGVADESGAQEPERRIGVIEGQRVMRDQL